MKSATRLLAVAAISVGIVSAIPATSATAHRQCTQHFTLDQVKRDIAKVYRGTALPPKGSYGRLHREIRCLADPAKAPAAQAFWKDQHDAWADRRHPFTTAI